MTPTMLRALERPGVWPIERLDAELGAELREAIAAGRLYREDIGGGWARIGLARRNDYTSTARKVDTAMSLTDRPCRFGACDEGQPCGRHARAAAVAERVERMRGRRVGR